MWRSLQDNPQMEGRYRLRDTNKLLRYSPGLERDVRVEDGFPLRCVRV